MPRGATAEVEGSFRNVDETRPRAAEAMARDASENEAAATKPGASGPFTADAANATTV